MRAMVLPCLVLLLAFASAGEGASKEEKNCHADDKAALLAIKAAFDNQDEFSTWTPGSPCCTWNYIDCDKFTGRVEGLYVIQAANLTGTIPDAIAGLTHLRTLIFRHVPRLSGPIPPALAKLANLSELTVSGTRVSGPVPSSLGALTALTLLDLSINKLTGAIPASLADLPNLDGIDLSRNHLVGAIPPGLFGKLIPAQQEVFLYLSHNNLSGSIPAEFASVNFASVNLSRNLLAGDASALFGRDKPVQVLDLSRNALEFNLSGVEFPVQVRYVDVSHNGIYGGIPAQVAKVSNLRRLNVSYNLLCGEVPPAVARFDVYSFQNNKCLCGAPLAPCS